MPDTKIGNNRWVPDIRSGKIQTFSEDSQNYKIVDVHPILNKVLDENAFFRTHAEAVYYNLKEKQSVASIIKEQQSTIDAQQTEITSLKAQHQKDIDALKTEITLAAPDRYQGVEIQDSWDQIKKNIQSNNVSRYHVGDYKTIQLSNPEETVRMQIAGIDTYYKTVDNIQLGHHIDWISVDCLKDTHQWNTSNNNNGTTTTKSPYMASEIKNYLTTTVYNRLPTDLKAVISDKRTLIEYRQGTSALTDSNSWGWENLGKLWLPSEYEVFGSVIWGTKGWSAGQAVQYPLFANNWLHGIKGLGNNNGRCYWWLCTAGSGNSTRCCYVSGDGVAYGGGASNSYGVPLCFRIAA